VVVKLAQKGNEVVVHKGITKLTQIIVKSHDPHQLNQLQFVWAVSILPPIWRQQQAWQKQSKHKDKP